MRQFMVLACALLSLSACDKIAELLPENTVTVEKNYIKPQPTHNGAQMMLPNFTDLVEHVGASVVSISVATTARTTGFEDLFDWINPNRDSETTSFGSGFIISPDGYIITNAHVIAHSKNIKVALMDRREFNAKLIGADEPSDIALLKIDAQNLPAAQIGNSASLKVGEWVAAIGAPFGFDNTVTSGIVSAKKRSLGNSNYMAFIQTDVAINPGNSGGPLFNLDGQVIGVNSQIYSKSGGYQGISFAVPMDIAMQVVDQLRTRGTVQRAQLGATIQEVTYDLSLAFGMQRPYGAAIIEIAPNSAAEKAGLQQGDVVIAVDGQNIENSIDLPILIGYKEPGSTVKISVWRDKSVVEKTVTLLPQSSVTSSLKRSLQSQSEHNTEFTIEDFGLNLTLRPLSNHGLLVVRHSDKSAFLKEGDVILRVGNIITSDESSFRRALKQYQQSFVSMLIVRDGQEMFLPFAPMK